MNRASVLVLFLSLLVLRVASKTASFWYYTDVHVDLKYKILNDSEKWGDYDRDASPIVAFTGIEFGNDHGGYDDIQPDFVILGGDAIPHGNMTEEEDEKTLAFLTHHLSYAFKSKKRPIYIIPVVGNHDTPYGNQMSPETDDPDRERWCGKLATTSTLWKAWVNPEYEELKPEALQSDFAKNCYHAQLLNPNAYRPQVVIALNGLVWYNKNSLVNLSIVDPLGQFEWLEGALEWIRMKRGHALIVSHFPVGAMDYDARAWRHLKPQYNERLMTIFKTYPDVIRAFLANHEHIDVFRVILDKEYKPIVPMFINPSIAPIRLRYIGSTNPRIRQYIYDHKSMKITDYNQYYLNLTEPGPSWKLEYQATQEYNITDVYPETLAKMLDEFTIMDNKGERWEKYWNHQLGGRPHEELTHTDGTGVCPEARSQCRCKQICTMRHNELNMLDDCLNICDASKTPELKTIDQLHQEATATTTTTQTSTTAPPLSTTTTQTSTTAPPLSTTTTTTQPQTSTQSPSSTGPPVKSTTTPSGVDGGLDGGKIAGIVIGVLLAVALVGGVIFWFYRKRRNSAM